MQIERGGEKARSSGYKLGKEKFRLDARKKLFAVMVVRGWHTPGSAPGGVGRGSEREVSVPMAGPVPGALYRPCSPEPSVPRAERCEGGRGAGPASRTCRAGRGCAGPGCDVDPAAPARGPSLRSALLRSLRAGPARPGPAGSAGSRGAAHHELVQRLAAVQLRQAGAVAGAEIHRPGAGHPGRGEPLARRRHPRLR